MWISKQPASVPAPQTDAAELREYLGRFAVPRHFHAQSQQNTRIGDAIARLLSDFGYEVCLQGRYRNVLARPRGVAGPYFLIGAHFDSVPGTPGADDNGSGLAVLLAVARALAGKNFPILIAAFNSEEDGLLGSADFAANCVCTGQLALQGAHILEMVGYTAPRQHYPFLPRWPGYPGHGNFIGIIGNWRSLRFGRSVLGGFRKNTNLAVESLFLPFDGWILPETRLSFVSSDFDIQAGYFHADFVFAQNALFALFFPSFTASWRVKVFSVGAQIGAHITTTPGAGPSLNRSFDLVFRSHCCCGRSRRWRGLRGWLARSGSRWASGRCGRRRWCSGYRSGARAFAWGE